MNLETKEQKIFKLQNCGRIHSFEDKIVITEYGFNDIENNIYRLYKLTKQGVLMFLDEKSIYAYDGSVNLGMFFNGCRMLIFSSKKLIISENI